MPDPNSGPAPIETTSGGRGDATLQRLVDGAQATFAERGYAAANIHEICARAKVGIGTFYAHFEHKRELLQQVMVERAPLLIDQLTPNDLVDARRIAAWLSAALDDPNATGLWRAWHEAVLEEPELSRFHASWYGDSLARLATMVTEARARLASQPERADADVVAWSILTLARELAIQDRRGAPDVGELAQLIRQLVVSTR
jgi:AcrR family transcriptional regulator